MDYRGQTLAISTPFTQMLSHKLRAEEDAILVGRVTDEREHPQLTVRHWVGSNPQRLVIDRRHPLNLQSLYAHQIQSLIVEGGAKTLQSFLEQGLWDELRVETNQTLTVDGGTVAPLVPADAMVVNSLFYDTNTIVTYRRKEL